VKSDEKTETSEIDNKTEDHMTKVYRKLIDVDSDKDIVLHGGYSVNSDKIIFDNLHFRCQGLDKISLNGKNVRFNRCTFHLEAGFLEINGTATFTDCIMVAENRTPLVQKIGGFVSLVGCHWLGSIEVESHPVYQPEMDEFEVGDVIYRDVCRNTEQNVQYFEPITDDEEDEEDEIVDEEDELVRLEKQAERLEKLERHLRGEGEDITAKLENKTNLDTGDSGSLTRKNTVIDEQAGGERVQVSEKANQVETAAPGIEHAVEV